jgi:hypothetical protein
MCFIAWGNRKIIHRIQADRNKLEQIAKVLDLDTTVLSKGTLVGIELLFEDETSGTGKGGSSGKSSSGKSSAGKASSAGQASPARKAR